MYLHLKAAKDVSDLLCMIDPAGSSPVVKFAKSTVLKGATTKLELVAYEASKLGQGPQRKRLVGQAIQEFKNTTEGAAPSDTMLPVLYSILRP